MRKELGKELRKEFDAAISREMPGFRQIAGGAPGHLRYQWRVTDALSVFLELLVSAKDDLFTLELGWSERHEFPGGGMQFTTRLFDEPGSGGKAASPVDGGLRFQIGDVLSPPCDHWWDVVSGETRAFKWRTERPIPAVSKVAGCVRDAVQVVKERALPYISNRTSVVS